MRHLALARLPLAALLLLGGIGALQANPATIGPGALVELAEQTVLLQLADAPFARGARRLKVVGGALDSRLRLGACDHPIQVVADLSREQSRVNARLSCAAPTPWSLYIPLELRVYRDVVVTTRALQRGDVLEPIDVALEERDALAPGGPALTRISDAVGRSARRSLDVNTVLSANLVESPVLVRRGDRISISSSSGGIAVKASAEALENGRAGERIRVRNTQSDRVIEVTITAAGQGQSLIAQNGG